MVDVAGATQAHAPANRPRQHGRAGDAGPNVEFDTGGVDLGNAPDYDGDGVPDYADNDADGDGVGDDNNWWAGARGSGARGAQAGFRVFGGLRRASAARWRVAAAARARCRPVGISDRTPVAGARLPSL